MTDKPPLQRTLDETLRAMLCPGAMIPSAQARFTVDDVGMFRCDVCHKPILIRNGYTSLHDRTPYLRTLDRAKDG